MITRIKNNQIALNQGVPALQTKIEPKIDQNVGISNSER